MKAMKHFLGSLTRLAHDDETKIIGLGAQLSILVIIITTAVSLPLLNQTLCFHHCYVFYKTRKLLFTVKTLS